MTRGDIVSEIVSARFNANQTASVRRWVNYRYAQLWSFADWPWKIVGPTAFSLTGSDNTPTTPADIDIPLAIYDDYGNPLSYLTQKDFDTLFLYSEDNGTRSRPTAYKWNDNVLTVGDVPDTAYNFNISYYRKLSHKDTLGAVTLGQMDTDTDSPLWDEQWHFILVVGAMATGLKMENDPTWEPFEQEWGVMLQGMTDQYLPSYSTAENMQYGREGGW